jgi:phospholipid/cholesterol/gamma-HCH transport system substrate-binding protein
MRHKGPNLLRLAVIGIIVIAVGVYIVFTKRIPFLHGYRFSADFASSNQLVPGFSPVRIAGVSVGKVVKIEAGPHNTSKVTMEVKQSGLPLHRDARVRIRPRLFLEGGFSVEVNPGSPDSPKLPDGGVLPQDQTAGPVQLHQILSAFDHSTRDDLRAFLADLDVALDHGGAKSLGQSFKPLSPVLRDTAQIAEAARGVREHDASGVVASSARIAGALADHEAQLRGLVRSLNTVTTATASRDTQLAASLHQIDLLVTQAPGKIDRINATLPAVNRFVTALRPSLRALPPVLDHAVPVLQQGRRLVSAGELPALVDALAPSVLRLHPLELALDRLFPLVTTVSDCVRTNAVPVLEAKAPDGALSTGRPIWQDLIHAFVGLSSSAQNFDGNGFEIRYLATAGETSIGTGQVPGLGTLSGSAAQPITGSRPTWLGPGVDITPYMRPDVPCAGQAVPDLTQRAAGGGATPTARHFTFPRQARLTPAELRQTVNRFNRGIRTISATVPTR